MMIERYPITIVANMGKKRLKHKLESCEGYTDMGISEPSSGDSIWKYLTYDGRLTDSENEMQIHVRMWRSDVDPYSFKNRIFSFIDDVLDVLEHYVTPLKVIYELNFFPDTGKTLCSPHYEPGWASKKHREMVEGHKEADYVSGTDMFANDLDRINVEYVRFSVPPRIQSDQYDNKQN